MKKILTHLTGIVCIVAILVAGSCNRGAKTENPQEEANDSLVVRIPDDSTTVLIYLKDTLIDGTMHLLMSDSRRPTCDVIDNLTTVAYPGDAVIFMKAFKSNVNKVIDIVLAEEEILSVEEEMEDKGLYKLIINSKPPEDTVVVKYDIIFTVKKDTFTIDPYLKIPPKQPTF